jgi:hypothetical protein
MALATEPVAPFGKIAEQPVELESGNGEPRGRSTVWLFQVSLGGAPPFNGD